MIYLNLIMTRGLKSLTYISSIFFSLFYVPQVIDNNWPGKHF